MFKGFLMIQGAEEFSPSRWPKQDFIFTDINCTVVIFPLIAFAVFAGDNVVTSGDSIVVVVAVLAIVTFTLFQRKC
ncbi:Hypothetical predicted protein [Octopus vulgaris]|uniref:Uncharacterized protein n=1 Tax=Octopus vulgaris TaxID=6645 RepID=A0AA36B4G8_OCTVU|nr:Hypothetical predicted protein [Octopus vulgaris]